MTFESKLLCEYVTDFVDLAYFEEDADTKTFICRRMLARIQNTITCYKESEVEEDSLTREDLEYAFCLDIIEPPFVSSFDYFNDDSLDRREKYENELRSLYNHCDLEDQSKLSDELFEQIKNHVSRAKHN